MGATNKSKYGNCLSQDHLDIMTYPIKTDEAVNIISSDYDLDEMDSWVDVYERGLNLESDFKANVSTYIGGYIQRKLEANFPSVYCKDFLESFDKFSNPEKKEEIKIMKAETLFRINLFCLLEEHTDIGTTFYRECRVYYYYLSTSPSLSFCGSLVIKII